MKKLKKMVLKTILLVDALITLAFGIFSLSYPYETFGTLISIEHANKDLILSLLSSLSFFYIVIGLVCFVGFRSKYPYIVWMGMVMLFRHGYLGINGVLSLDMEKDWLVGSLTPDIIVHSSFVLLYSLGICFLIKRRKTDLIVLKDN